MVAYGSHDVARYKTNTNQRITVVPSESPPPFQIINNYQYDWNGDGFNGGLFIGYKYLINPIFAVSAEFYGDLSSLSGDFNGTSINNQSPNFLANAKIILFAFVWTSPPGRSWKSFTSFALSIY